jgi:hypothetical protein
MDTLVIERLTIEPRGVGGDMNLMLRVSCGTVPPPSYAKLVDRGLNLFWTIFGESKYKALNAEVMAWSDAERLDILVPHEYRVTIDFGLN